MNRDPIGEEGGINLYGFVANYSVNRWDLLGLFSDVDSDVLGHALGGGHLVIRWLPNPRSITIETERIELTGGEDRIQSALQARAAGLCQQESVTVDEIVGGVQTIHLWSLGRINVRLDGTIACAGGSEMEGVIWEFTGSMDPQTDTFDFNALPFGSQGRGADPGGVAAEVLVGAFRLLGNGVAGVPRFDINFTGPQDVTITGEVSCAN